MGKMHKPTDLLLPYQQDWRADGSRFKVGVWARQTGKSFTTASDTVEDCLQRKTTWVTLSAGERQALEWMLKAREWVEAWKVAVEDYQEIRDSAEAVLKAAEIRLPNGSRIVGIPANPATARGYSANLTLDEFAFHENPDAIWRAIYPSISNPLRGVYKLRVVSTPNGRGNKFAEIVAKGIPYLTERGDGKALRRQGYGGQAGKFGAGKLGGKTEDGGQRTEGKKGQWSLHVNDILSCVKRGLPLDVEELRAGLDDPDGWAQEYLCEFVDAAAILLSYELLALCERMEATTAVDPDFWRVRPGQYPVDLGIDFGRKKDLTVCWAAEQIAHLQITREVLELAKMPTPEQVEILRPRIQRARRVALDYTGPGIGMGDYLVKEFGEYRPEGHLFGKIELVTMSNPVKCEIFGKLRQAMERQELLIPAARVVREDLHSVQRVVTKTGMVSYRAPHTDDGHADRAVGAALCVRAGGKEGISPQVFVVE
jgi:phage FluMu gp28-like protein